MTTRPTVFHAPTRPYGPIDALNRRAAATGSPRYAKSTSHANYNGHQIQVWWNSYRGYYIAEYTWAGRCVIARGEFNKVLRAAMDMHNLGALGSSVSVSFKEGGDSEAVEVCRATEGLVEGERPEVLPWYSWRHRCAAASVRDSAHPSGICMRFDWQLMQACETEAEYREKLRERHGSEWT